MSRSCPLLPAMLLATVVFACNDELKQEVPEDVCFGVGPNYSVRPGTQWIGGRRASPEMYPGRDCVGCHLDNDGPELMFGGTVYPYEQRFDFGRDATRAAPTGDDCYGLEGVTVTVTGGDGQEYVTTTNAAGNFFLEGKASDLVKPYRVNISYQPDFQDTPIAPDMGEQPYYGGCGLCHSLDAVQFPMGRRSDPLPPGVTLDERVLPAGTKVGIGGLLDFARDM